MARVALINPPLTMKERYGHLRSGGSHLPPLQLANLAAVSRQEGHPTIILDPACKNQKSEEVIRELIDFSPDVVGITSVTISIHNAANLARLIKEHLNVPVIIGGVHISNAPQKTMEKFPEFDIAVLGEGEITFCELLKALDNREDLKDIKGIAFRDNGKIVYTEPRERIEDLDTLPFPAWDLLPNLVKYYRPAANSFRRLPASSLITSRGCPGKCTFCSSGVFGNKMRAYSAGYLMEMIEILHYKYGIKEIIFHDDNFVTYRQRLIQVCEEMIRRKMDLIWSCTSRVDIVTPELLKLMKRAGCWQIAYGIESGDQRILDVIKKGITLEQIRNALKWTKQAGIQTRGYLMIGMPTETIETMQKTIDFIKEIDLDDMHISAFTPGPGTEALKTIHQYGTFDDDWSVMNYWRPLFVPYGLTKELILHYQSKAFKEFYFRPKIIIRWLLSIRSLRHFFILLKSSLTILFSLLFFRNKNRE